MNGYELLVPMFGIGMPGPAELIIILVIVLVVFGHNRIPQLGEALGKGIRNFKRSFDKDETTVEPESVRVTPVTDGRPKEKEQSRSESTMSSQSEKDA